MIRSQRRHRTNSSCWLHQTNQTQEPGFSAKPGSLPSIMHIQLQSLWRSAVLFLSVLLPLIIAVPVASQPVKPPEVHWQAGFVSMKDDVKLAYILYKPAKEGRFPVLVTYDAYWGGGSPVHQEEVELLRHGYATVAVSVRGTGASEGTFGGPFAKE